MTGPGPERDRAEAVHLELLVFAEAANRTAEGKLNILGEFNVIFAEAVPVIHPMMHVVIRIQCPTSVGDRHRIGLRWINEDGQIVSPHFQAGISFGPPFRPGMPHRIQLILPLQNARFEEFGAYELELTLDDTVVGSSAFYVMQAETPRAPES